MEFALILNIRVMKIDDGRRGVDVLHKKSFKGKKLRISSLNETMYLLHLCILKLPYVGANIPLSKTYESSE